MGYATVSHVEAFCLARAPFTNSTTPNASQVAVYIEDASIEVEDVLLREGYVAPVDPSASYAFRFMQGAVAKVAAYYVEQNAPTSGRLDSSKTMRDNALKMITDGEVIGLVKAADEAWPRSGAVQGATPAFTADQMF